MVIGVHWWNHDDSKVDGESPERGVLVVTDDRESRGGGGTFRCRRERGSLVSAWNSLGLTARCLGCVSMLRETARQAQTENGRKTIEDGTEGTVKAEAGERRVKGYLDGAAEKGRRRRTRASSNDRTDGRRLWGLDPSGVRGGAAAQERE